MIYEIILIIVIIVFDYILADIFWLIYHELKHAICFTKIAGKPAYIVLGYNINDEKDNAIFEKNWEGERYIKIKKINIYLPKGFAYNVLKKNRKGYFNSRYRTHDNLKHEDIKAIAIAPYKSLKFINAICSIIAVISIIKILSIIKLWGSIEEIYGKYFSQMYIKNNFNFIDLLIVISVFFICSVINNKVGEKEFKIANKKIRNDRYYYENPEEFYID